MFAIDNTHITQGTENKLPNKTQIIRLKKKKKKFESC